MTANTFDHWFGTLTGHDSPLTWQTRLFERFIENDLPSVIAVPTGLGKTMVMAVWLIARAMKPDILPTRLFYVVDRRTVVDQATDDAKKLVENWGKLSECGEDKQLCDRPPAISTLRGQLADNREWSRDPSRPAIIIGTVDLIGSALLFAGYRSSYKRRPLEAGLLGRDSLLVLDEAHLSRPFEKLLKAIEGFNTSCDGLGKPMQVIRMSATSGETDKDDVFRLDTDANSKEFDLWSEIDENGNEKNSIKTRFEAKKRLTIKNLGAKDKLAERLAEEAVKLAKEKPGSRIVVFVRKPDDAATVSQNIREREKPSKSKSNPDPKGPYADSVAVLTGTMRGLERDELVTPPTEESQHKRRVMQRFLKPDNDPSQGNCFLVSTSAGEVGFDLNADHLVGDEAPLDSWIQRLGRVNRRGLGDATVILVAENKPADKIKTDFDKACAATTKLLSESLDGKDVSPKTLVSLGLDHCEKIPVSELQPLALAVGDDDFLKHRRERGVAVLRRSACTPEPTTVELTDILLDAWSMTSIRERMPGRPEVAPWLRGIDDELPQTTIAWRVELDLDGFADLDLDDIEEWFDTHRILAHETLSVKTEDAAAWFKKRWAALPEALQRELGNRHVIIDLAGLELVPLVKVIERLSRKTDGDTFLRGAEVIVPASFGGICRGVGLLDHTEPKLDNDDEKKPPEEQESLLRTRQDESDVADIAPGFFRQRIIDKTIAGEKQEPRILGGGTQPKSKASLRVELESDDDKTVRLVSYVPRFEKPETGQQPQTLKEHVDAVRQAVDNLLARLPLPNSIKQAVQLAADWHDRGKDRERWQRLLVFPKDFVKPNEPMGKSGGEMRRDPRGYRHEFGSLRELTDAFNGGRLLDNDGQQVSREVFDLAMHLIAAHHGRGRPHFPKGGFDPLAESRSDDLHTESIRRFAWLQRKYGRWGLAWLENLFRCADYLASEDDESTGIDEMEGGEK